MKEIVSEEKKLKGRWMRIGRNRALENMGTYIL
jgi:hypothetical protein